MPLEDEATELLQGHDAPCVSGTAARTALFICTQHWNSCFQVGMHHMARSFARAGWRVGFVSAPIGLPHMLGFGADARQRTAAWRSGGQTDAGSGVWHYVPFAPLPWGTSAFFGHPGYLPTAWASAAPGLSRALRRAGLDRPDFACADHLLHEGLMNAAKPRIRAFRRADNTAGFPGANDSYRAREIEFARTSDLTIVTAEGARQELLRAGISDPMVIENGAALDRFFHQRPKPLCYADEERPVIVYVGAADQWLDEQLLLQCVKARPRYCWTFIGPFRGELANRLERAGAKLTGSIPHDELAAYLQHARVGLVPFSLTDHQTLIRGISPLKLFEYSACGLPVVGTRGCIYPDDLPTPLSVCDSSDDFLAEVDRHVRSPKPEPPSAQVMRRFGWDERLKPLMHWLDTRLATI